MSVKIMPLREIDYICPICGCYGGVFWGESDESIDTLLKEHKDKCECRFCHNKNLAIITDDEMREILRNMPDEKFHKYSNDKHLFGSVPPDDMGQIREYLRQKFAYNSPDFNQGLCDLRVRQYEEAMAKEAQARRDRERAEREATRPRCPTCHSTDIKPITVTQKAGSFLMLGIFSQKIKHQFHCNHCGYEW